MTDRYAFLAMSLTLLALGAYGIINSGSLRERQKNFRAYANIFWARHFDVRPLDNPINNAPPWLGGIIAIAMGLFFGYLFLSH